jgi:hypothetical protein
MIRYLGHAPKREYPQGVRLVHNFYPGPHDDPGRDREIGVGGFRVWIIDEPPGSYGNEHRCYCGCPDGREHYGTVGYVDARGCLLLALPRRR